MEQARLWQIQPFQVCLPPQDAIRCYVFIISEQSELHERLRRRNRRVAVSFLVHADCDCSLLARVPGPLEGKLAGQWQSFASVLAGEVQSADAGQVGTPACDHRGALPQLNLASCAMVEVLPCTSSHLLLMTCRAGMWSSMATASQRSEQLLQHNCHPLISTTPGSASVNRPGF